MKFGKEALSKAMGAISAHQVQDSDGRKLLDKGQVISEADIQALQAAKIDWLAIVRLEAGDIQENEAAQRIAYVLTGENVITTSSSMGRVKVLAEKAGILHLDAALLERFNSIDEAIAIATLPNHSLVQAEQVIASVKIVPYAVDVTWIEELEVIAKENAPLLNLRPLQRHSVALLITGNDKEREKLIADYESVVRNRLESLGSRLDSIVFCAHEENEIAAILRQFQAVGFGLILIAGIAATIDRNDVVPSALRMAGGTITRLGLPIEPGTLLMLAYLGDIPVLAANSLKQSDKNAVDLLLPRLLSGEKLSQSDFAAMGHGGLISEDAKPSSRA